MTDNARKDFISNMKEQLDELDARMDDLDKKREELSGDARKEYDKRLHELAELRRDAEKRLKDVQTAGEEKWQQVKDEAEHTRKALNNSFNYFLSHFK